MAKKPEPFFNPFEAKMKGLKAELEKKQEAEAQAAIEAKKKPKKPPPPAAPERPLAPKEEDRMFLEAMSGVKRVGAKADKKAAARPPPSPRQSARDENDAETDASLADLIDAGVDFWIAEGVETLEGTMVGLDRRILQRLKRGEYAVEGSLDLHGMVQKQARDAVRRFVMAQRGAGHRCVLIVHGRGKGSEDHVPVLKLALKAWLEHGDIGKNVLAFASARPEDGGTGAVYVLLRKRVMSL